MTLCSRYLGQLAEYFQEEQLKGLARQVLDVAGPLIRQNISGVLNKVHLG